MKFGLIPVNVGIPRADVLVQAGRKADEVGLESLWTFEHVIVPVDYQSKYPYSADGKMGVTPETNFVDPILALTAIAASTSRVRLGTGVNILSQQNPLYVAKQAASLDFISGGRLMLGVGIGWLREEFEALGVPFERRGARFDDYVQAMRKVWSGEVVEHQSDFVHWTGFKSFPLPVQKPLPVHIGGSKGKAFRRIAKYGDGWFAPTARLEQLAELLKPLREACDAEGRDPAEIEISCMFVPGVEPLDAVPRYAELGVDRLIVPGLALGTPNPVEAVDKLANEVMAKVG